MKKLLILTMMVIGSLVAASANAQMHIEAQIGERDYPGYSYYTYPAWHGHMRDRVYYEHYHSRFYREHKRYFRGRREFDHDRYERSHNRGHDRH